MPLLGAVRNDETAMFSAREDAFRAAPDALAVGSDRLHHALGIVLKKFASGCSEKL
jgi:hypothetical protein